MVQGAIVKAKTKWFPGKLFDIIPDFLNFRKHRIVLNEPYSSWTSTEAEVS